MEVAIVINNPTACGIGEGAACCAFLVGQPGRFMCGRTLSGIERQIRARLAEGTMNAKYDPGADPYPECQELRPRVRGNALPTGEGTPA